MNHTNPVHFSVKTLWGLLVNVPFISAALPIYADTQGTREWRWMNVMNEEFKLTMVSPLVNRTIPLPSS